MDKEVAMALGRICEQINELGKRIDSLASQRDEQRQADIDFLAMEAGIDMLDNDDKMEVE